ncbi:MAG: sigma-54-dependent Fis family transcriptional regulator [Deltaproteobacteria bacterium]|nr:sigma-54-dependent Fis family transcriptional regulator [Deltaproteobacteria bacterium]
MLVVEDDAASRDGLEALLGARGFEVRAVASVEAATALLGGEVTQAGSGDIDVAFVDLGLPDGDGMDLIRPLASRPGGCAVVVLTGERRLERAVEAMRRGAVDYLTKPLEATALELALGRIERVLDARDERRRLGRELMRHGTYEGLVGRSAAMQRVYEAIERCAPTDLPVLVRGESGTGKELVARALHQVSRRRRGPFVAINCGAIPQQLAESELFGHERGAFTGATRAQAGAFERASGGTLFLDEVTEMPLELQVVLLRALETGRVQRVGGARELAVDVRIVAATNRDPALAVKEGRLRKDLYFRLDVLPLPLAPLREREGDVLLLAEHFRAAQAPDDDVRFSRAAETAMLAYAWPGNVRELRNVVQRAVVMRRAPSIEPEDLGLPAGPVATPEGTRATSGAGAAAGVVIPADATLEDAERVLVLAQLERQRWNRGATAHALGIAPKTLYNKLRSWGVRGPGDAPDGG